MEVAFGLRDAVGGDGRERGSSFADPHTEGMRHMNDADEDSIAASLKEDLVPGIDGSGVQLRRTSTKNYRIVATQFFQALQ